MRESSGAEFETSDERARVSRRQFLQGGASIGLVAATAGMWGCRMVDTFRTGGPRQAFDMRQGASDLTVQPVLAYSVVPRVEGRSWRYWGSVQTEAAATQEAQYIQDELKKLSGAADFGMRVLPVVKVTKGEQIAAIKDTKADAIVLYPGCGWTDVFNAVVGLGKPVVVFLRRHSGRYYLWDEIVHARFLRAHTDHLGQTPLGVNDVVVDDLDELKWRLRALYGLRNTLGRRIVCIGGPTGWATREAPQRARERFKLDMITVQIPELNAMIEAGRKDQPLMAQCRQDAESYLAPRSVTLKTTREAVAEAFLLRKLFDDLMTKHDAHAITTRACMNSYAGIMPCLTLGLINDSGRMAYCESDFVVIPSGILMHFICAKPTYMCNPTYPFKGRMLFAHCAAPRRMDGKHLEPVDVVTHYESDHGAASHVKFRKGQPLTIIKPDFEAKHWLALTGTILDTPVLATCRAQVEVELNADTQQVLKNLRGFHCMLAYGDYTREVAYAAAKVGIDVQTLS